MPDVEASWILGSVLLHLAVKGSQGLTTAARLRQEPKMGSAIFIHNNSSHSNNTNNGSNSNNKNGSHSNNNNVCLRAWD